METGWNLLSSAFLLLAGFFLNTALGNLFGESGLGVYTLAVTIYMLVTTVAVLGLPLVLTKYTAEFSEQVHIRAEFFTATITIVLFSTIVFALVLYLVRSALAGLFNMPELVGLLPILALGIPFYGFNKVALGRLNGLRQMDRLAISEIIRYLLMIGLTLAAVVWLKTGIKGAIWALSLTELILAPLLWLFTQFHRHIRFTNFFQRSENLIRFGFPVIIARVVGDLDGRLSVLLIGALLTKAEIGVFAFAAMMADGLGVLPIALEKVTGPVMTQLFSEKRTNALKRLINQTIQLTIFLLSLGSLVLVMFFPHIVGLLFPDRPGFLDAELVFTILAIGAIYQGNIIALGPIFISVNRPDVMFKFNLERIIMNVILTLIFVNFWGIAGAALAKTAATLLIFIIRMRVMESVADVQVNYKPTFYIPLLASFAVGISLILPGGLLIGITLKVLLGLFFAVFVLKVWHLDHYIKRLRQELIPL